MLAGHRSVYKRGDIVWVDFGECKGSVQGGVRPALVTQNDKGNYYSPTIQVAPLTSKSKTNLPTHMQLDERCGLSCKSTVLFEQSRVIDINEQVLKYIGHIELTKWAEIKILIVHGCLGFLGEKFKKYVCVNN